MDDLMGARLIQKAENAHCWKKENPFSGPFFDDEFSLKVLFL